MTSDEVRPGAVPRSALVVKVLKRISNKITLTLTLSRLTGYVFSVLAPYQRSAAFTPLQRWTISERLGIHEPRVSVDVEAASRPRSFGKALNTYPALAGCNAGHVTEPF